MLDAASIKELKAETSPLLPPGLLLDMLPTCRDYLTPAKVVLGPFVPATFVSHKEVIELAGQLMQRANFAVLQNPSQFAADEVRAQQVSPPTSANETEIIQQRTQYGMWHVSLWFLCKAVRVD
jgi:hypothetical protein